MPKVNGKTFRCPCGCNVFHKEEDPNIYICNSCNAKYEGIPLKKEKL